MGIKVDSSKMQLKIDGALAKIIEARKKAVHDIASEILRLSTQYVPHDTGMLQSSGVVVDENDKSIVGYNKVYASRLHEHPEYRFQKGRQGKYLETPIKNNMNTFIKYYKDMVADCFR